jgi:hypothetical protein
MSTAPTEPTLHQLRAEFGRSRLISMPIAGAIAWSAAGVFGAILPDADSASIALFLCMPAVFPLALVIGRFTGEDVFGAQHQNDLDRLFGYGILMAMLVWGIAIPFWMVEPSSLPLSGGILTGLMWVPLSWILQHWVGLFHAISRTLLVAAAWFAFPRHRFVVIPAVIVVIYLISIAALARRPLPEAAARRGSGSSA